MTPGTFLVGTIDPGLDFVADLAGPKPTDDVRRFLLAVALQESGKALTARYQNSPSGTPGPARGWWQFEQGGGVTGVLNHQASATLAKLACDALTIVNQPAAVWRALEGHDVLAATFARLLLWTDPQPVPTTEAAAWDCYAKRLWRPGAPHPETWPQNWATAGAAVASMPLGASAAPIA